MKKFLKYLFLMGLVLYGIFLLNMKEEDPNSITIAFYNVENLFDTLDDPLTNDNKFIPQSKYVWTSERNNQKIRNFGEVICKILMVLKFWAFVK